MSRGKGQREGSIVGYLTEEESNTYLTLTYATGRGTQVVVGPFKDEAHLKQTKEAIPFTLANLLSGNLTVISPERLIELGHIVGTREGILEAQWRRAVNEGQTTKGLEEWKTEITCVLAL